MFPTLDEVRAYAAEGRYRRVPVCMELLADRFTPTEVLRCLRSVSNHVFLLESAETDGTQGRYSFLGFNPTLELSCTNGLLRIREGGADDLERTTEHQVAHPGPAIREVLARYASPQVEGLRAPSAACSTCTACCAPRIPAPTCYSSPATTWSWRAHRPKR